jgi:hypothetical protein
MLIPYIWNNKKLIHIHNQNSGTFYSLYNLLWYWQRKLPEKEKIIYSRDYTEEMEIHKNARTVLKAMIYLRNLKLRSTFLPLKLRQQFFISAYKFHLIFLNAT